MARNQGPPLPRRSRSLSRRRSALLLVDLGRRFVEHRILGLAAEIAFFALLSLPPLVFGLTGAIGFVADRYDPGVVHAFRDGLVVVAGNFLTANVLDTVVTPTLDSVLAEGRIDVISIGFLIALWAGSRTMVVLMDTIAIMYGKAGHRSILSSWAASFGIYVLLILVCALVVPAMLIGPGLVGLSTTSDLLGQVVFWSAVLAGGVTLLTGVFHACLPRRRAWARDLPGAVLTVVIWYGGSWLLKYGLAVSFNSPTLYGPLAAPIVVLIWLYLIALAVLVGAAFNASLEDVRSPGAGRVEREPEREPDVPPRGTRLEPPVTES
ncbi:MAG: YihY/virulence factor BrkB family protein [Micropruina sp.]